MLCGFLIVSSAFGQNGKSIRPDYNQIELEIQRQGSAFYYPFLMERYKANDTTLTMQEYRHLYYGYIFQSGYEPYWRCQHEQSRINILKQGKLTAENIETLINYCLECIEDFPFDIRSIRMLSHLYRLSDDSANADLFLVKGKNLLSTIISSGNGKRPRRAMHVISTTHQYELLDGLDLVPTGQSLIRNKYDFISVEKNQFKVKGFYFNVEKIFEINRLRRDI